MEGYSAYEWIHKEASLLSGGETHSRIQRTGEAGEAGISPAICEPRRKIHRKGQHESLLTTCNSNSQSLLGLTRHAITARSLNLSHDFRHQKMVET